MDFGLARELYGEDPAITAPGVLVGTANYVAPEQARYGTASPARTCTRSARCCTTR